MNRTRIALFAGGLAAVTVTAWALWPSGPDVPAPDTLTTLPVHGSDDASARFVAGRTDNYRVLWTSEGSVVPMADADALRVASHLDASLLITTVAIEGDTVVQELSLRDVQRFDVRMGGQSQALPLDALEEATARVERTLDGDVVNVTLSADAPELAASTLRGIALSALVEHPADGERLTPYGLAADSWDGDVRTTTGYTTVDVGAFDDLSVTGEATTRWGTGGRLLALTAHESLTVQRGGVAVLDVTDALQLAWQRTDTHTVAGTYAPAPQVAQRGLTARAESLSPEAVLTQAQAYDGTDSVDAQAIMWAGTAQVAMDPAQGDRIARIAREPGQPQKVRELSLDLLAHAPGGAGEAALLTALMDPELQADPAWPAYLQRIGFVEQPSDAVIDFAHTQMDSADSEVRYAAMAATGAVARQVDVSGKGSADDVLAPLRGLEPTDAIAHAAVLRGLGNAGQISDRDRLVRATHNDAPAVRAAAIHALRHYASDDVTTVMTTALTDSVPAVQRAAISRLTERGLGPQGLTVLHDAVTNGQIAGSNVQLTIGALAPHAHSDQGRSALATLVEHPQGDPRSRARIRALLMP